MLLMLLSASVSASIPVALPMKARAFIKNELKLDRYRAALADLNGDKKPEIIVYADEASFCGSGGCRLYVLTPHARSYVVVTRLSVSRPPIRVLATSTKGWNDLGVRVAGGGIAQAYEARLRFDGRSYPRNPTIAPAIPSGKASGQIVME